VPNKYPCYVLLGVLALAAEFATAQPAYPSRPVRVLIGSPAGSTADVLARPIAQRLSEQLGVPFVVDNRSGATGLIANEHVVKAQPDGHTLLLIPGSQISIVPHVAARLSYDTLRDFTPIMQTNAFGYALVTHPSVPAKSVKDLLAIANEKPGTLTFASSGTGSGFHLAGELFQAMGKVRMLHVPYKGSPPAIIDVLGGRVDMMFLALGLVHPHVKKGALRLIAVTGADRDPLEPGVPTIAQSGIPGYEASGWHGIVGPAGIPADIVTRLNTTLVRIMATQEIRDVWATQGMKVVANSPQEFATRMKQDYEKYGKLIRNAGIKPQ
jgi:tripartite-type tricarboxylate transporter receptor subunit TctC